MRKIFFSTIFFFCTFCSCYQVDKERLQKQLVVLQNSTPETFGEVYDALKEECDRGISYGDALLILDALDKTYPVREYEFQDTQADLLELLRAYHAPDIIPHLTGVFVKVSEAGQREIIRLLSYVNDKKAVAGIWQLLESMRSTPLENITFAGWDEKLYQAKSVFPGIWDFLDITGYRYAILYTTYVYLEKGKINLDKYKAEKSLFISTCHTLEKEIAGLEIDRKRKNWFYAEDYQSVREELAMLLDILGYMHDRELADVLTAAETCEDPRLVHFALVSLMKQGTPPDPDTVNFIAADPEMRQWLFAELEKKNLLDLFPAGFMTQEKLAESNMVNWLIYPTELATAPDAIELMKVFDDGGGGQYFLFRFKTDPPHWAAEDGWIAGISGPFKIGTYPTVASGGGTFSNFTKWEEKTPEAHFTEITGLVANAREKKSE